MAVAPGKGQPSALSRLLSDIRRAAFVELPDWLPHWVVRIFGYTGVLVFGLTGFTADPHGPGVLANPIPLYLWLCALVAMVFFSMLRYPYHGAGFTATRSQVTLAGVVMLISVILAGLLIFDANQIAPLLQRLAQALGTHTGQLLAIVINFWFLGFFWVDTIRRWVGEIRSRPEGSAVGTLLERRAGGDLLVAGVLAGVLALFLNAGLLTFLSHLTHIPRPGGQVVDPCYVSIHRGCQSNTHIAFFETLSGIDVAQMLVYVLLGAVLLATSLLVAGLPNKREGTEEPAQAGIGAVDKELTRTLREAFGSRARLVTEMLIWPVHSALWPAMLLVAALCETQAAIFIQSYLRALSNQHLRRALLDRWPDTYQLLGQGIGYGALAALLTVIAATLLFYDHRAPEQYFWRIASYWLPALGLVGLVVLAPFFGYSIALGAFNVLLMLLHRYGPLTQAPAQPFFPFGVSTYIVLIVFVVLGILRRMRH